NVPGGSDLAFGDSIVGGIAGIALPGALLILAGIIGLVVIFIIRVVKKSRARWEAPARSEPGPAWSPPAAPGLQTGPPAAPGLQTGPPPGARPGTPPASKIPPPGAEPGSPPNAEPGSPPTAEPGSPPGVRP